MFKLCVQLSHDLYACSNADAAIHSDLIYKHYLYNLSLLNINNYIYTLLVYMYINMWTLKSCFQEFFFLYPLRANRLFYLFDSLNQFSIPSFEFVRFEFYESDPFIKFIDQLWNCSQAVLKSWVIHVNKKLLFAEEFNSNSGLLVELINCTYSDSLRFHVNIQLLLVFLNLTI